MRHRNIIFNQTGAQNVGNNLHAMLLGKHKPSFDIYVHVLKVLIIAARRAVWSIVFALLPSKSRTSTQNTMRTPKPISLPPVVQVRFSRP